MTLNEFFIKNPKIALGFSGGVDSSYLLYTAKKYGADIQPYFIKSQFQPDFELEDAKRLCGELGVSLITIQANALWDPDVTKNDKNRCYYCKRSIFGKLKEAAFKDGYTVIIDGNNASDDASDRPGMKAVEELSVLSPLRDCKLTKTEIRRLSREAGLFTWNKPAYACLATRVPTGEVITETKLQKIERAENFLFSLDFSDFRVRLMEDTAKIQLPGNQLPLFLEKREVILEGLDFFTDVLLDLKAR